MRTADAHFDCAHDHHTRASTTASSLYERTDLDHRAPPDAAISRMRRGTITQCSSSSTERGTQLPALRPAVVHRGRARPGRVQLPRRSGRTPWQQMFYGDFKPLADRHDFLIVAPDGQDSAEWPAFQSHQRARPPERRAHGAARCSTDIEAKLCVDPDSRLLHRACRMAARSPRPSRAPRARQVRRVRARRGEPLLRGRLRRHPSTSRSPSFTGTADPHRAVQRRSGGVLRRHRSCPAAPASMAGWAAHDHCDKDFTDTGSDPKCAGATWSGCDPAKRGGLLHHRRRRTYLARRDLAREDSA